MAQTEEILILRQKDLNKTAFRKIARLKKNWWNYPLHKQISYLKKLPPDDQHILLIRKKELISYLRFVKRLAHVGKVAFRVGGLSTVCTDKAWQKKGFARRLVERTKKFIIDGMCDFVLLQCGEEHVAFYRKCGFKKVNYRFFCYNGRKEKIPFFKETVVMMYPLKKFHQSEIEIKGKAF